MGTAGFLDDDVTDRKSDYSITILRARESEHWCESFQARERMVAMKVRGVGVTDLVSSRSASPR